MTETGTRTLATKSRVRDWLPLRQLPAGVAAA